jgi:hypothetical protein
VSIIGILAVICAWQFIIVPVIAVIVYIVVDSYVEFGREQDNGMPE